MSTSCADQLYLIMISFCCFRQRTQPNARAITSTNLLFKYVRKSRADDTKATEHKHQGWMFKHVRIIFLTTLQLSLLIVNFRGVPNQGNMNLDNRLPGQKTPTSASNPHMANFPSPLTPGGSSMPGEFRADLIRKRHR